MDSEFHLLAGDLVEVLSPEEIEKTLDPDGTLHGLPFMPEMAEYCSRRFRLQRYAEKTCMDMGRGYYTTRPFYQKDVVLLEGLRCSGANHDGCQRICMIFWKMAWLRPVQTGEAPAMVNEAAVRRLQSKLKTKSSPDRYFCQSTELVKITNPEGMRPTLTLSQCWTDVRSKAVGVTAMLKLIALPYYRRLRDRLFGRPRLLGTLTRTPSETLGLQPGDLVEIKSLEEMRATLDRDGRNRGLICDLELEQFSGKRYRVLGRLDKMISESTGEMRKVEATVMLEGNACLCWWSVGGCPRGEFGYFREIWLRRVDGQDAACQPAVKDAVACAGNADRRM